MIMIGEKVEISLRSQPREMVVRDSNCYCASMKGQLMPSLKQGVLRSAWNPLIRKVLENLNWQLDVRVNPLVSTCIPCYSVWFWSLEMRIHYKQGGKVFPKREKWKLIATMALCPDCWQGSSCRKCNIVAHSSRLREAAPAYALHVYFKVEMGKFGFPPPCINSEMKLSLGKISKKFLHLLNQTECWKHS